MAERLDVLQDGEVIRSVPLKGQTLSIGRRSSNDLVLDDPSVSKHHARLVRKGEGWSIEDLESTNGIVIGGVRVRESPVVVGKDVGMGKYVLRLVVGGETVPGGQVPRGVDAEAYQDLLALFRLNERFASVINTEELLDTVIDSLMEAFRADRGFILLGTDPYAGLETAVRRGIPTTGADATTSRTFISKALETGEPVLATDQAIFPETVEKSIHSVLCAPLLDRDGSAFGVVYLDSQIVTRIFGDQDKALLREACAQVAAAIRREQERERLQAEVSKRRVLAREEALREHDFRDIIGRSAAIRDCLAQVEAVAPQEVTVLIQGESGTGKELFAKAIHYGSPRRDGPFVAINCMALSPEIIESELFGHEKGAFSGAIAQRIGKLELADGGTVFLDEIGDLSQEVQVKLLRVLEQREIQRVGGNRTIPLDVRVITATHVDLRQAVTQGRFREDLFYRLNVFTLFLPPLKERKEDIAQLVDFFVDQLNDKMGKSVDGMEDDALAALAAYDWPGNIRELRNVVERAMVLTRGDRIPLFALPFDIKKGALSGVIPASAGGGARPGPATGPGPTPSTGTLSEDRGMRDALGEVEHRMILDSLAASKGNISAAARALGIQRKTLHRKIETLGIDMRQYGKNREALDRESILEALDRCKGSISATARDLGVPRTTLYRNMEMFGIDPGEARTG